MGCGRGGGGYEGERLGALGGGARQDTVKQHLGALWSLKKTTKTNKRNQKQVAVICAAKHAAQQPCFLLGVSQQLQLGTADNTLGFMLAVGQPAVSDLPQCRQ